MAGWLAALATAEAVVAVSCCLAGVAAALRGATSHRQSWWWLSAAGLGWATGQGWIMAEGLPHDVRGAISLGTVAIASSLPIVAIIGLARHPALSGVRPSEWIWIPLNVLTILLATLAVLWQLPVILSWREWLGPGQALFVGWHILVDTSIGALMATILLHRLCRQHPDLRWLVGGLFAVANADLVGLVASVTRSQVPIAVVSPLWFGGFLAIGLIAVRQARARPRAGSPRAVPANGVPGRLRPCGSLRCHAIPHVAVLAAGLVVTGQWLAGLPIGAGSIGLLALLGLAALVHQQLLIIMSHRLISQLDQHERRLSLSRRQDPVTGLPNRAEFEVLLRQACARRADRPVTVVKVRPSQGHLLDHFSSEQANTIAVELAHRLASRLGPADHLARVADTTFALIVHGTVAMATDLVQEVMLAAESPIQVGRLSIHLSLSAGLATTPDQGKPEIPPEGLDRHAVIAMQTVATVPGGIAVFTPDMFDRHRAETQLRTAVARALRGATLPAVTVVFEPMIDLRENRMIGMAARAQWRDPEHGLISAGHLATLARQAGLARRLDHAVISEATAAFAQWRERWPDLCGQLWITISTDTLSGSGPALDALVEASGRWNRSLALDLIEERPWSQAVRSNLRRLRLAGAQLVTSDVLQSEPTDAIESDYFDISPVLVARCVDDLRARLLIQATIEFASARTAQTTTRQVSQVEQHERLRELGVTVARGPLYGTPLERAEAGNLIEQAASGHWQTPVKRESQRRRSLEAWQELRHIVSQLPVAAFACDRSGALVMAEGALFESLGMPSDILGQKLVDVIGDLQHQATDPALTDGLRQAREGTPSVVTIPLGSQWLQVHARPRRSSDGALIGTLGIAVDVTHRVQIEQALRDSEQRFREIFAQAPVGMVIVDADGQIVAANPAIAAMLGYDPQELLGLSMSALWHPENPSVAESPFERLRQKTTTGYDAEFAYCHRDGSPVLARTTAGVLSGMATPDTVLGIVEDLRVVKQLEVGLRHSQKLEAVGMLAAGIAHEINTPIQFISDNTNFLSNAYAQVAQVLDAANRLIPQAGEDATRELATIGDQADLPWLLDQIPKAATHALEGVAQVANIVRAMRNFGHPDQRERSYVDVNAAVEDTSIIAHNELKHVANLRLDLGDIPPVLGYPSDLNQVILNLLVNAAHAIADAGHDERSKGDIHVRTWAEPDAVFLMISDNGCGMTPETQLRIFDPFFTTKEVGRGTGQGLTIVYGVVVDKHQGTVTVDSTVGEGTTFTIRLPIMEELDLFDEFDLDADTGPRSDSG